MGNINWESYRQSLTELKFEGPLSLECACKRFPAPMRKGWSRSKNTGDPRLFADGAEHRDVSFAGRKRKTDCPWSFRGAWARFLREYGYGRFGYLLPVIQPTITGFSGAAHSKDFHITDKNLAYILPAKLMAATVIDLLTDGAAKATAVMRDNPRKEKTEYFALWDALLK